MESSNKSHLYEIHYICWILVIALALIAGAYFFSGCGNGGTDDPGTAPSITGINVHNSYPYFLSGFINWEDPDGDLSKISFDLYDENGSLIASSTSTLDDTSSNRAGKISIQIDLTPLDIGDYDIEFYLTDSKGNSSNTTSNNFSIEGGFGAAIQYPSMDDTRLQDTAIGDLNGDNRNDVVAINSSKGLISIYYQNEFGFLDEPVIIDLEVDHDIAISGISVADVNGDGRSDLITIIKFSNTFCIIFQDPATGEMLSPQEFTSIIIDFNSFAVDDINEDNLNDIILIQSDSLGVLYSNIAIFLQDNNGSLGSEYDIHVDGFAFSGIRISDMNDDGMKDMVFSCDSDRLAILKQTSPGVFNQEPETYSVEAGENDYPWYSSFEIGDLNGDDLNDIVTVDSNDGCINILLQNSQGALGDHVVLQTSLRPFGVEIADITGDGLNDIILDEDDGIAVFPQKNDLILFDIDFRSYHHYSSTWGGSHVRNALSVGDITGDGKLDAVVSWSDDGIYVFPYDKVIIVHE